MDQEPKAQRGEATCLSAHSQIRIQSQPLYHSIPTLSPCSESSGKRSSAMKCGQGTRDSGSLRRNRNTGQYGAANDSLLPACGSLIKIMQNSLLMTLIVEFGHEMKNICGVNKKSGSSFF